MAEDTIEETAEETVEEAAAEKREQRKVRVGTVVSDKMQKTVVVQIERLVKHPVYKRYVRRRKRFKVHDENNESHTGDTISFMETRPMSKEKRWRLLEIIERAR